MNSGQKDSVNSLPLHSNIKENQMKKVTLMPKLDMEE